MSNEIFLGCQVSYNDGNKVDTPPQAGGLRDSAGKIIASNQFSASASGNGSAVPLGALGTAALATYRFINHDPTNYASVTLSAGGSKILYLPPGGIPCAGVFGSDVSTPYVLANTAVCLIEVQLYGP